MILRNNKVIIKIMKTEIISIYSKCQIKIINRRIAKNMNYKIKMIDLLFKYYIYSFFYYNEK